MNDPQSQQNIRERRLFAAFEIGVVLKGINAILETILGIVLLVWGHAITTLVTALIENELVEDPNNFLATHLVGHVPSASTDLFAGLYLSSHGIIKGLLVLGLLRNKSWAYPSSLFVFALFVIYQIIKWSSTHSAWLLVLTAFDLIVMWLIWHEWRRRSAAIV